MRQPPPQATCSTHRSQQTSSLLQVHASTLPTVRGTRHGAASPMYCATLLAPFRLLRRDSHPSTLVYPPPTSCAGIKRSHGAVDSREVAGEYSVHRRRSVFHADTISNALPQQNHWMRSFEVAQPRANAPEGRLLPTEVGSWDAVKRLRRGTIHRHGQAEFGIIHSSACNSSLVVHMQDKKLMDADRKRAHA